METLAVAVSAGLARMHFDPAVLDEVQAGLGDEVEVAAREATEQAVVAVGKLLGLDLAGHVVQVRLVHAQLDDGAGDGEVAALDDLVECRDRPVLLNLTCGAAACDRTAREPEVPARERARGAPDLDRVRAEDPGQRNRESFRACIDVLARGGCIGIFPEGTSAHEPRLQPLKTGTVRIALQAEQEHDWKLGVAIVPAPGLTLAEAEADKERAREERDEFRRRRVDRAALIGLDFTLFVDRFADDIHDPAQRGVAHRHCDRTAGVGDYLAAGGNAGVAGLVDALGRDLDCHAALKAAGVLYRNLHVSPRICGRKPARMFSVSCVSGSLSSWCERRDSNSHGLPHWHLKPARLPIPPLSPE